MSNTEKRQKNLNMVTLSLLLAIEVVLVITGLGFIMIPPISITILHIPVIIGAIVMGKKAGLFLGGSFGVLSMLQATFKGSSLADLAFSPFYSGSPISSIIMCIGCRMLLGFVAGFVYEKLSEKTGKVSVSAAVAAFLATLVHTLTVMSCLWLLFPELAVTFKAVLQTIFALNFLVEAGVAVVLGLAFANVIPMLRKKFAAPKKADNT